MKRARWPASESELLAPVVAWLKADGFEVYQEVEPRRSGGICDVVAVKDGEALAVEGKRSLGLDVLGQALSWRERAHRVAIAVPAGSRFGAGGRGAQFALDACRALNVGWLSVHRGWGDGPVVRWVHEPRPAEPLSRTTFLDVLHERHKDFSAAGSPNGHRVTPFSLWREGVIAFVAAHPGCTAKQIAAGVEHHYASDGSAAAQACRWAEAFGLERRSLPGARGDRFSVAAPAKEAAS